MDYVKQIVMKLKNWNLLEVMELNMSILVMAVCVRYVCREKVFYGMTLHELIMLGGM